MVSFTAGLLLGGLFMFVFMLLIMVVLVVFMVLKGKHVTLYNLTRRDKDMRVAEKVKIYHNQGNFQWSSGKADIEEVFERGIFGKKRRIELEKVNRRVIFGDRLENTIILNGIKDLELYNQNVMAKLETDLARQKSENIELALTLDSIEKKFNYKLDERVKAIVDSVVKVQPFIPMKGRK
jgi:hypothetical protein